jgi:hypothetical protein
MLAISLALTAVIARAGTRSRTRQEQGNRTYRGPFRRWWEVGRVRQSQRRYRVGVLTADPQQRPAAHEHLQLRSSRQQRGDPGGVHGMLEVIEYEREIAVTQGVL